jgi:hypothetical protein
MFRADNKKDMLTIFLCGGVTVLFLIPLLSPISLWAKLVSLFFAIYVVYLTLRLVWCLTEPADASVSLKPRAIYLDHRAVCLICGKNPQSGRSLEVRYRGKSVKATYVGILIGGGMSEGELFGVYFY